MSENNNSTEETAGPKQTGLVEYRSFLIKADYAASKAYDKAIMTLSGGALGLSMAFLKDIAPKPADCTIALIALSWLFLTTSIGSTLVSMLTSQFALRKAIKQVDEGSIYKQRPGASFAWLTSALTITAGTLFVVGIFFLAWFCVANMTT